MGADKVANLFAVLLDRVGAALSVEPAQANGSPGIFLRLHGELDMVLAVRVEDGLVTGLYTVRNPEKLSRVHRETAVSR